MIDICFCIKGLYSLNEKCWNVGMLEFRQSPVGEIKIVFIEIEKQNYRNSLSEVQHSNIPTFFHHWMRKRNIYMYA